MASPIKIQRLVHSIIYEEYLGDTGTGASYAAPIEITRVKCNPDTKTIKTGNSYEKVAMMVVFVDYVNSVPSGLPMFKQKSRVTFVDAPGNMTKGTIDIAKDFYVDSNEPHHYELEVI